MMSVCSGRRTKDLASSSSPQRTNLLLVVSTVFWRRCQCLASLRGACTKAAAGISRREQGRSFFRHFSFFDAGVTYTALCVDTVFLSLTLFHSPPNWGLVCLASCLCSFSPNCDISGEQEESISHTTSPYTGACTCHRVVFRTWMVVRLWWWCRFSHCINS